VATPRSREARRFFRCALQRREEADVLFESGYNTGAIYLAGYCVECILKALILANTPHAQQAKVLDLFRGAKAHDYNQLKAWNRERGGPPPPSSVNPSFTLVESWSTALRYSTESLKEEDAQEFLDAVDAIMEWASGRF